MPRVRGPLVLLLALVTIGCGPATSSSSNGSGSLANTLQSSGLQPTSNGSVAGAVAGAAAIAGAVEHGGGATRQPRRPGPRDEYVYPSPRSESPDVAAPAPTCEGLCLPGEICRVENGKQDCVRERQTPPRD